MRSVPIAARSQNASSGKNPRCRLLAFAREITCRISAGSGPRVLRVTCAPGKRQSNADYATRVAHLQRAYAGVQRALTYNSDHLPGRQKALQVQFLGNGIFWTAAATNPNTVSRP